MERTHGFIISLLCALLAAFLWAACVVSAGAELPRTQRTVQGLKAAPGGRLQAFPQSASTEQIKPSASATPEVTQLRPDCAAGGGKAIEMVLAGKNLPGPFPNAQGPRWRFFPTVECQREVAGEVARGSFNLTVESLTFESPTRAVAKVLIPESKENAHCQLSMYAGVLDFKIVNISLSQTIELKAHFLAEGNLSGQKLMERQMAELHADPTSATATGLLSASPSSIKFVQGDKTLFDKPASSLKAGEAPMELFVMGYFRIVFNDGKVYNFRNAGKVPVCSGGKYTELWPAEALKKKFGK